MDNEECVFCKIASGKIATKFLYETDELLVFRDTHPSAPIHYLIVPRKHIKNIEETSDDIWAAIKNMALKIKGEEYHKGFRLVNNYGSTALIEHMHVHYLSGIKKDRKL